MAVKEGATDHASVYTVELLAITLALRWLGGNNRTNALIASDSWAALNSIKTMKSCRCYTAFTTGGRLSVFCGFLLMQGLREMRMQIYLQNKHSGHKQ